MSTNDTKGPSDPMPTSRSSRIDVHLSAREDEGAIRPDADVLDLAGDLVAACRTIAEGEAERTASDGLFASWTLPDGRRVIMERVDQNTSSMVEKLELLAPSDASVEDGDDHDGWSPTIRIVATGTTPTNRDHDDAEPLARALQGHDALRAIRDGRLLHWDDDIVVEAVREACARALSHVDDPNPADAMLQPPTAWSEGHGHATYGADRMSRTTPGSRTETIDASALPTMAIVRCARRKDGAPFVVMRPAWLNPEGVHASRSPVERLRASAMLETLLARAAERRAALEDDGAQG